MDNDPSEEAPDPKLDKDASTTPAKNSPSSGGPQKLWAKFKLKLEGEPNAQALLEHLVKRLEAGEFGSGAESATAPGAEIGQGGQGTVHEVEQTTLGRTVAIKRPLPGASITRFIREAVLTAALEHPSIVPVHSIHVNRSFSSEDGKNADAEYDVFYTMKYIRGATLRAILNNLGMLPEADWTTAEHKVRELNLLPTKNGAIDHDTVLPFLLNVLIRVCEAVQFAHSHPLQVIHRDLKPDNIIVGEHGEVMVLDWGIAVPLGTDALRELQIGSLFLNDRTNTQSSGGTLQQGTPDYSPEEQWSTDCRPTRAMDVFALGVILREVLTLNRKAMPDRANFCNPFAFKSLWPVTSKATDVNPFRRYSGVSDFKQEIQHYLTGRVTQAQNASFITHLTAVVKQHKGVSLTTTVAAFILCTVLAISIHKIQKEKSSAEISAEKAMHERDKANNANFAATKARNSAEALVNYMLFDLSEKLRPLGKLDLLDGVSKQVEDYYRGASAEELRKNRNYAVMLGNRGRIEYQRRNIQKAKPYAEAAWIQKKAIADANPLSESAKIDLGKALVDKGDLELASLDYQKAFSYFLDAYNLVTPLPDESEAKHEVIALSQSRQAEVYQKAGNLPKAMDATKLALAAHRKMNSDKEIKTARSHVILMQKLSDYEFKSEDIAAARDHADQAQLLLDGLLKDEPEHPDLLRSRAFGLEQIAKIRKRESNLKGARDALQESYQIRERLCEADKINGTLHMELAATLSQMGDIAMESKSIETAENCYKKMMPILEQLRSGGPISGSIGGDFTDLDIELHYSGAFDKLGKLFLAKHNRKAALHFFEESINVINDVIKKNGNLMELQLRKAATATHLADIQMSDKNHTEASQLLRDSLSGLEASVPETSNSQEALNFTASVLERLGECSLFVKNQLSQSVEFFGRSLKLRTQQLERNPASITAKKGMARCHCGLAQALEMSGTPGVQDHWNKSLAILNELEMAGGLNDTELVWLQQVRMAAQK